MYRSTVLRALGALTAFALAGTGLAVGAAPVSAAPPPAAPQPAAPPAAAAAQAPGDNHAVDDPFTAPRTRWWREARFGMFIHFGTYAQWGGEYVKPDGSTCRYDNAEWILFRCQIPMARYEQRARSFDPAAFDAAGIVKLAKDAGQKYIVITSKHHDGYAMWPTKVNKWNLRDHSAFDRNRDLLAELKREADRQGIKLGLYYSILDWHHPAFGTDMARYKRDMYAQLKELVDGYSPAVFWFDGQWPGQWTTRDGEDLERYVRGLDPAVVVNNRVGKKRVVDGDYGTPEQTIPTAPVEGQLWESCMTINGSWGYTNWNNTWKPASTLTRNLLDIAGRGGNYLLNIGPDPQGRVPTPSVDRLRAMGAWLGANGQGAAVHGADEPGLVDDPSWGAVSKAGDKLLVSVYTWPGAGKPLHLRARAPLTVTGARVLGSDQQVTVRAAGDGYDLVPAGAAVSPVATVIELTLQPPPPPPPVHGLGLTGQYFANPTWRGTPALTRVDRTLNFAWKATGSPAPGIPTDGFSVRWTGSLLPQYSGTYTLRTVSDETVRVWVDGKLVIDNTTPHGPAVNSATVTLTGGRHPIRVEHTERSGEAYLKLLWSGPLVRQQVITDAVLYPT